MKCTTITEVDGSNPAFRPAAQRAAKRAGEKYDITPTVRHPVGTEIVGKGAFVLCTLVEPLAVPADKECYDAVVAHFSKPSLKKRYEMLQNMKTPAVFNQLPKGMKRYVETMTQKWSGSTAEKIINAEQAIAEPTEPKAAKKNA